MDDNTKTTSSGNQLTIKTSGATYELQADEADYATDWAQVLDALIGERLRVGPQQLPLLARVAELLATSNLEEQTTVSLTEQLQGEFGADAWQQFARWATKRLDAALQVCRRQ